MATIASKLQALENQRQTIVQACIDCGYSVGSGATLYEAFQVLNTETEAGMGMASATTPIGKLQKLHRAYVQLVNYAFDAQLTNSATFTQIAESIMPMETEAYALLLQNSSFNYDLVFTRGSGLSAGGTYGGKTIYKAYTGIEENEITTVNSIPWYTYRSNIYHVRFDDTVKPPNLMFFFWGLTNCQTIDLDGLDATASTTLNRTFTNCAKITEIDLSVIEMGDVLETSYLFQGCTLLEDIIFGDLDTSNTTKMDRMFGGCTALTSLDLSWMSTESLTDCSFMFNGCSNLAELKVDGWDLDGIGTYQSMFYGCNALTELDLSTWGNIYINNNNEFFKSIPNLRTIYAAANTAWTSKYPTTAFFADCDSLVGGAGTAFVSGQTNTIAYARIDGYNDLPGYFTEKPDFTGEAYAVMIPDSGSKYELHFFRAATAPAAGDTYQDKTIAYVFSGFENTVYTSNSQIPWYSQHANITSVHFDGWVKPTTCAYWFYWQTSCTSYDLAKLDTSMCTSFAFMFYSCTALTSLDMTKQKTSNVTSINYMFYNCTALTSLLTGAWDMSKLDVLAQAFRNMTAITELDFSRWTMPEYTSTMYYMFYNCNKLVTIYVPPGTDLSDTGVNGYCFGQCTKLVGGNGTAFSTSAITADMAKVDGLNGAAGYFTAKTN